MHISISNHHFQVGYVMNVKNQFVEVFKLSRLVAIQGEPSELSPKLQEKTERLLSNVTTVQCFSLAFEHGVCTSPLSFYD